MELTTVAQFLHEFYRLVGSVQADPALVEQGESENDVAYEYLTRGCRSAQRWMLKQGYQGWQKRSSAISWSGTDSADGGRYWSLPTDFLRAVGSKRVSALREANGDPWGKQIETRDSTLTGKGYYFEGDTLWLTRNAQPPTTLYLRYHHTHPVWTSVVTIDFPVDARALIPAEAADAAMLENWLPGGQEMRQTIHAALTRARE